MDMHMDLYLNVFEYDVVNFPIEKILNHKNHMKMVYLFYKKEKICFIFNILI